MSINIKVPSFPGEVVVGDYETEELMISIASQVSEAVSAIVRFPSPPSNGPFKWSAGDYIISFGAPPLSVAIEFSPRGQGTAVQALETISNAPGSPHQLVLRGTGIKGMSVSHSRGQFNETYQPFSRYSFRDPRFGGRK
jgi:hypothetical protein